MQSETVTAVCVQCTVEGETVIGVCVCVCVCVQCTVQSETVLGDA